MGNHPFLLMQKIVVPIENYKALGCAIIQQAVEDYVEGLLSEEYLRSFIYNTLWIRCLDLDLDYLMENAIKKKEGGKHAERKSY